MGVVMWAAGSRSAAPAAYAATGDLKRFDVDFILGSAGGALHIDQVLERRNAYRDAIELRWRDRGRVGLSDSTLIRARSLLRDRIDDAT
jgi:hypothetical protein